MTYELFDLTVDIKIKYPETAIRLKEFLKGATESADIYVEITDEEIENEKKAIPGFQNDYYEMICIFRHIMEEILDFNGMFIHSSVVEMNKKGYMFTGVSGSGKSTHTLEWKKCFGDDLRIINGDKPIIRFFEDGIYAYGSPWCGREGWHKKDKVLLNSVCFIKKSNVNKIRKIEKKEVFNMMLTQVVIPKKTQRKLVHYDLLDKFIKKLDFYELECDISEEAVLCAYNEFVNKEE